ncbi:hypothetical protein ACHAXT_007104 [Thalassiosira profunda]
MTTTSSSDRSAWIGEGSTGGRLDASTDADSTSTTTISFASATQGTPFNIRLNGPEGAPSDIYYEVKITELAKGSSLAVGFVTSDGFQPGWKTRGAFYNGNITNGSAGLIIGFGPRVKEGDTVGAYLRHVIRIEDYTKRWIIMFYHNGKCLGAGFSLEDEGERYFPCLHLSGSATVIRYTSPTPPTIFAREPEDHGGDPYTGQWAIEQAFSGPELGQILLPEDATCRTIAFERVDTATPSTTEGAEYRLTATVDNSFHTTLEIPGSIGAFDRIQFTAPCAATRKMPRPAFQELERLLETSLSADGGWKKMIVASEGRLVVSGPTSEVVCSRYMESFEPCWVFSSVSRKASFENISSTAAISASVK